MTRKYFGTDGIRGTANTPPMTPEIAMRLGMAAGKYFRTTSPRRHSVVIGKDTRLSGYMIEPALVAGFTSVGMDVTLFGPLPTPGVAMMTRSLRADLGVMISASHNSYEDNGIKLFGPNGYKLSDEIELEIESRMDRALDDPVGLFSLRHNLSPLATHSKWTAPPRSFVSRAFLPNTKQEYPEGVCSHIRRSTPIF